MLGEEIKAWRYQKGMSQKELAKRINVAESTVKAWEKNQNRPTPQHWLDLTNLMSKLGMSPIEIEMMYKRTQK